MSWARLPPTLKTKKSNLLDKPLSDTVLHRNRGLHSACFVRVGASRVQLLEH